MLDELTYAYATGAVIVAVGVWHLVRKTFDPFAPLWLFLVGYLQVYVVQAVSYHEYAVRVRGVDLVTQANARALWALLWFLVVYLSGVGKLLAARLPRAPETWSTGLVVGISPFMIGWGLFCSGIVIFGNNDPREISAEEMLLRQFPIVMLVAGILLIVTGRQPARPRPMMTACGLAIAALYVLLWTFNGKRSHSLIGVLTAVAAFYLPLGKRPRALVLALTACAGILVVTLAIGWRSNYRYERSFNGFLEYILEFDPSSILVNLNLKDRNEPGLVSKEPVTYETEEYGGYILMMDTVPAKSAYDYGTPYIRLVSTYIPRILWADKPYFGREAWVNAWIAGSEFKRDTNFTGPAISVLGAAQLNGGAWGTLLVIAALALLTRTMYEYFRLYSTSSWAQAWWAMTYYNAWLMTVNDDPFVWFYYLYGHTVLPPMAFLWICHRLGAGQGGDGHA